MAMTWGESGTTHSRQACVNMSSTFIPGAAPIRAKLNTINPTSIRSRRRTGER
jgi:hypothetical protein